MKIIRGKTQTALILSDDELLYIAVSVGHTNNTDVSNSADRMFKGRVAKPIGSSVYTDLRKAVLDEDYKGP